MAMTFAPLQLPYSTARLAENITVTPPAEDLSGDRIRDYIIQRMTARMNGYQAEMTDLQRFSMGLTPTFGAQGTDTFASPSSNLSSLLNMHFDLNTLQMLNKT